MRARNAISIIPRTPPHPKRGSGDAVWSRVFLAYCGAGIVVERLSERISYQSRRAVNIILRRRWIEAERCVLSAHETYWTHAGFNRLYEAGWKSGPIIEEMCWARARQACEAANASKCFRMNRRILSVSDGLRRIPQFFFLASSGESVGDLVLG
jgi:hypothetical protein